MSLTGFFDGDDDDDGTEVAAGGCMICEIVGNGLRARDEGNEGVRFWTGRLIAG